MPSSAVYSQCRTTTLRKLNHVIWWLYIFILCCTEKYYYFDLGTKNVGLVRTCWSCLFLSAGHSGLEPLMKTGRTNQRQGEEVIVHTVCSSSIQGPGTKKVLQTPQKTMWKEEQNLLHGALPRGEDDFDFWETSASVKRSIASRSILIRLAGASIQGIFFSFILKITVNRIYLHNCMG